MILGASTPSRVRRALRAAGAALALAALVSCGGGTSQRDPYQPGRYFAFGDETSVLTAEGRKYSVNVPNATGGVDCASEPIWVQAVATQYGYAFAQCNPSGLPANAVMRATVGARVDDVAAQIDTQVAAGGFAEKDLATVLAGAHDILDLYAQFPQRSEAELTAEARLRGERLAAQVNRLVGFGLRVIVATLPDLGLTPFALHQKSIHTDTDRAALLSRLTAAFNGRVRVTILNDGRFVGLILADELIQTLARNGTFFAINNATTPVCTVPLPDCTTQTLVAQGTSAGFLWADDRRLAFGGHRQLGVLAIDRATGNPF